MDVRRLMDYLLGSAILMFICFLALGFSVSTLLADILGKLDPLDLLRNSPGQLVGADRQKLPFIMTHTILLPR
jgi:hypothetical protein